MAFKLAEAFVEFRQRGLTRVQAQIGTVGNKFRSATRIVTSFQGTLAGLGVGAGLTGLVKLAADAETAQVKFEVLLKSGDKAAKMMAEINDLAAKTPFQKLDIANATQKLLAFGSAEDEVLGQIRQIGDIAALTGIRIEELAEIYGKAQVQGRLFAEDINQLTGRGIPIIQELAKQFGVAESEVRGLVTAGKVTADNIQQAFRDMTTGAGQFAGGMARLSRTTSGQFSTLLDNLKMAGAEFGASLLPAVNQMLAMATKGAQALKTVLAPSFEVVGAALAEMTGTGFEFNEDGLKAIGATLASITEQVIDFVQFFGDIVVEIGPAVAILGAFTLAAAKAAGAVAFFMSPVTILVGGLAMMVKALLETEGGFESLSNLGSSALKLLITLFETAKGLAGGLVEAISALFSELTGGEPAVKTIVDGLTDIMDLLTVVIRNWEASFLLMGLVAINTAEDIADAFNSIPSKIENLKPQIREALGLPELKKEFEIFGLKFGGDRKDTSPKEQPKIPGAVPAEERIERVVGEPDLPDAGPAVPAFTERQRERQIRDTKIESILKGFADEVDKLRQGREKDVELPEKIRIDESALLEDTKKPDKKEEEQKKDKDADVLAFEELANKVQTAGEAKPEVEEQKKTNELLGETNNWLNQMAQKLTPERAAGIAAQGQTLGVPGLVAGLAAPAVEAAGGKEEFVGMLGGLIGSASNAVAGIQAQADTERRTTQSVQSEAERLMEVSRKAGDVFPGFETSNPFRDAKIDSNIANGVTADIKAGNAIAEKGNEHLGQISKYMKDVLGALGGELNVKNDAPAIIGR